MKLTDVWMVVGVLAIAFQGTVAASEDAPSPGPGQTMLAYESGQCEMPMSPWNGGPGCLAGVRFTPPAYPFQIDEIWLFVSKFGKPDTAFSVALYDHDPALPQSGWGERLDKGEKVLVAKKPNSWVKADYSADGIVIKEGDFFAAMKWLTDPGEKGKNAQFTCSEKFGETDRTFMYFASTNKGRQFKDRNLLFRVIGKAGGS